RARRLQLAGGARRVRRAWRRAAARGLDVARRHDHARAGVVRPQRRAALRALSGERRGARDPAVGADARDRARRAGAGRRVPAGRASAERATPRRHMRKMMRTNRRMLLTSALATLVLFATHGRADAAAVVGQPAPAFTLTDTNGKQHSLADFKGKYVVLEWVNHECPF